MSLEAGQRLTHYSLIKKIGEGGMGVVWKALDTKLEREVAIKILPEEYSTDPARLARFEQEAKAVAALNHPKIVSIYAIEEVDGLHFFAMELVDGEPLTKHVPDRGLPLDRLLELAIPMADALSVAHERGITHRDLKPANIMITADQQVKILDFGLAKLRRERPVAESTDVPTETASMTRQGTVMGTVPYMSPEQVEGRPVDQRSDIFSLGATLYEMATGRRPFLGETAPGLMSSILRETPVPVNEVNPALPAELGRIIAHCLRKDPEHRYQTAKGLRNELEELRTTTRTEPAAPAPHAPVASTTRNRIAWLVLATVGVGLAIAAAVFFGRRSTSVPDPSVKRIVVLPFENLGPPEDEYFAAGMTEEITSRLAAVSGLRVISRTSARAYAGTTKRVGEIGQELEVGYVIEGTVRWDRDAAGLGRVRITPQLIRVADDTHLWSERYDRLLEDVFTIQSDIAAEVIDQLQMTLLEPERRAIEDRPTENMEAYQAYLLGLQYWWAGEEERTARLMLEVLERAVKLDPEFALAHALLSQAHSQYFHYKIDFTAERCSRARHSAERALELQPDLAKAHLALAWYHYWCHRDYDAALAEIALAERRQPNDPDVLTAKWAVSRRMGRWQVALETLERALEIDPQGYLTLYELGDTLHMVRDYARADEHLRRAIAVAPDRPDAYYYAVRNYLVWDGGTERARRLLVGAPTFDDPRLVFMSLLLEYHDRDFGTLLAGIEQLEVDAVDLIEAYLPKELLRCAVLERTGDRQRARAACESAVSFLTSELERRPYDHRLFTALGQAYAILGRDEDAVTYGKRAVEEWPVSKDAIDGTTPAIELAKVYARVGDHDRAIDQLEYLLSIPCSLSVPLLRLDSAWDPLRDNPRFRDLLERYDQNAAH